MDSARPARRTIGAAGLVGAFVASLCCAGPLVLAALGVVSIPVAGALASKLFYGYWPAFVGGGISLSVASLAVHYRRGGVCTLDQAKRRRREIVNAVGATVLAFAVAYLLWDFVIVEAIGIFMGLWQSPIGAANR